MSAYYVVKKLANGGAIVESSNPTAKQGFFGWGSDHDGTDMSYYGNSIDHRGGDNARWRWTLSSGGVQEMIRLIEQHINDKNYYKGNEVKAARELLVKLKSGKKVGSRVRVRRYKTNKDPSSPTFSKEWSGVTGAPKCQAGSCGSCGGTLHHEGGSHYCPTCDDFKPRPTSCRNG